MIAPDLPELKNCPFCDHKAMRLISKKVRCSNITCTLGNSLLEFVPLEWNTRPSNKTKPQAIYEAIIKAEVGDDIIIHNEDMSVWCILTLVTREHPERK